MLKISTVENETKRQMVLEGKLVAPWTDELISVCQGGASELDHRELVIDVRGLTVISADGEDVLLALMLQGAKFRGSDVFTKQILKQLARRARGNGKVPSKSNGASRLAGGASTSGCLPTQARVCRNGMDGSVGETNWNPCDRSEGEV